MTRPAKNRPFDMEIGVRGDVADVVAVLNAPRHSPAVRSRWTVRRLLIASDLVMLLVAFLGAELFYRIDTGTTGRSLSVLAEFAVFAATLPLWVILASAHSLYRHDQDRISHSTAEEVAEILHLVTLGAWLLVTTALVTSWISVDPPKVTLFWVLAVPTLILGRLVVRAAVRRSPGFRQRLLLAGCGAPTDLVVRKISHHPEYGLDLIGVVSFGEEPPAVPSPSDGSRLEVGAIDEILDARAPDRVMVVTSDADNATIGKIVNAARRRGIRIDLIPHGYEVIGPRARLYFLEGLAMTGVGPMDWTKGSRFAKRAIDVVGSAMLLFMTAPVFAVVGFRIWRESGRPIFFRQTRLGAGLEPFTVLKFRSMAVDADQQQHADYMQRALTGRPDESSGGLFKMEHAQTTRIGQWIRRTSLDELPQLINVLRGEMSLVGPRPCVPYETEGYAPQDFDRFAVKPGLTGYWQVVARAHSTPREALDMDVMYVWNWSLGLDLVLLLRTPLAVYRQRRGTL